MIFEYARKAIQVGALDYITKPIEEKYLSELMIKTRKQIQKRKHKSDEEKSSKGEITGLCKPIKG